MKVQCAAKEHYLGDGVSSHRCATAQDPARQMLILSGAAPSKPTWRETIPRAHNRQLTSSNLLRHGPNASFPFSFSSQSHYSSPFASDNPVGL